MQQEAAEGEKCIGCSAGIIDSETGKCDICGHQDLKTTTAKEAAKLPKGKGGGYGCFYHFHKRQQRLKLARALR